MDERQLQIFRAVAEQRSFTRAAELLHMAQPTVSQQVLGLEAALGVRLFDRTTRAVELTPAGRVLYAQAGDLLQRVAEVTRSVRQAAGEIGGRLTVGASMTIGQYLLPPIAARFARDLPIVDLRLRIQNTEQIVHQVTTGVLDLGLVEGPVPAGELHEEVFLADEIVWIAPADHPWRHKAVIQPADLLNERVILREPGSGTRKVVEEYLAAAGLDGLSVAMEIEGTEAIKGVVEAGLGVAPISTWTVRKELSLGSLIHRPFGPQPLRRTFRAIYPRGRTLLPSAALLLQRLRDCEAMANQEFLGARGRMKAPVVE